MLKLLEISLCKCDLFCNVRIKLLQLVKTLLKYLSFVQHSLTSKSEIKKSSLYSTIQFMFRWLEDLYSQNKWTYSCN